MQPLEGSTEARAADLPLLSPAVTFLLGKNKLIDAFKVTFECVLETFAVSLKSVDDHGIRTKSANTNENMITTIIARLFRVTARWQAFANVEWGGVIVTEAAMVTAEDGIPSGQLKGKKLRQSQQGRRSHAFTRQTVACLGISLLAMMHSSIAVRMGSGERRCGTTCRLPPSHESTTTVSGCPPFQS